MSSLNTDPKGCFRRGESTFCSTFRPDPPSREMLPSFRCREKRGQVGPVPASVMLGKRSAPAHPAGPRTACPPFLHPLDALRSQKAPRLGSHLSPRTHAWAPQAALGSCGGWSGCGRLHGDTQACTCSHTHPPCTPGDTTARALDDSRPSIHPASLAPCSAAPRSPQGLSSASSPTRDLPLPLRCSRSLTERGAWQLCLASRRPRHPGAT